MREGLSEFLAYIRFQWKTRRMTPEQVVMTFGNHAGTPYRPRTTGGCPATVDGDPFCNSEPCPGCRRQFVDDCRGGSWCVGC